ncbi:MAG: hypothetical protein GXO02_00075 [Epsilonproteobacteria bacterium]|nr:hypothetical protein [Campylobacterota bacterium]
MLEYGVKNIVKNPTLITKTDEIIKIVDSRTKKIRAYVLPASYKEYIEEIIKNIEAKEWLEEKKRLLKNKDKDYLDEIEEAARESIREYLDEEG